MSADADIVIIGAGCAGLSLAAALSKRRLSARVLLLEPRTAYTRDRTWCFWDTAPHPFSAAVSHRWHRWRVSAGTRSALQHSSAYPYCHISGDAFYRRALQTVDQSPTQQMRLGVCVSSIRPKVGGPQVVDTDRGQVSARLVFDSRPPSETGAGGPALIQRFTGFHVRIGQTAFDPETVELMRFLPSDTDGRVRFLYLLPFSTTEALVEMTYLDRPDLPPPDAEQYLQTWLDEHTGGAPVEVLHREQGALPMSASAPSARRPGGAVYPIGIRAGRLKPSSGYGFLRIQRHSAAIAQALLSGSAIPAAAEPPFYRLLDALFLRALANSPHLAPALFLTLFSKAPPDALARFLTERSGLPEALRVVLQLPPLTMLRALLRSPSAHPLAVQPDRGAIL